MARQVACVELTTGPRTGIRPRRSRIRLSTGTAILRLQGVKPKLSDEQKQQMKECFELMDQDGSGAIDAEELGAAFKLLGKRTVSTTGANVNGFSIILSRASAPCSISFLRETVRPCRKVTLRAAHRLARNIDVADIVHMTGSCSGPLRCFNPWNGSRGSMCTSGPSGWGPDVPGAPSVGAGGPCFSPQRHRCLCKRNASSQVSA
jgi:hypothetical protein